MCGTKQGAPVDRWFRQEKVQKVELIGRNHSFQQRAWEDATKDAPLSGDNPSKEIMGVLCMTQK